MIPMTHPDLRIRVSLMVEILRLKFTLGTLCLLLIPKSLVLFMGTKDTLVSVIEICNFSLKDGFPSMDTLPNERSQDGVGKYIVTVQ